MGEVKFEHGLYTLVDGDKIVRKGEEEEEKKDDEAELISVNVAIERYIEGRMLALGLEKKLVDKGCPVYMSRNLDGNAPIVVLIQNKIGSKPGVWSRTLCHQAGLRQGSMLSTIERCLSAGFAVLILNPNTNSILIETEAKKIQRLPIVNSSTPEEHVLYCYEHYIPENARVLILTLGNGASLALDIVERELALRKIPKMCALACVEASHLISRRSTAATASAVLSKHALALEARGPWLERIQETEDRLGCASLSVGPRRYDGNSAAALTQSLDLIFRFFSAALIESSNFEAHTFANSEVQVRNFRAPPPPALTPYQAQRRHGNTSEDDYLYDDHDTMTTTTIDLLAVPPDNKTAWWWPCRFLAFQQCCDQRRCGPKIQIHQRQQQQQQQQKNNIKTNKRRSLSKVPAPASVADFVLENIIGKTAFGKVMLVRKKHGIDSGVAYAMKVLKKKDVQAHAEQALAERAILVRIRHPFIVRLSYAFQTRAHLYLVTPYYPGGNLKTHMEKTTAPRGYFCQERASFYAAEIGIAIEHLHHCGVIHRDIKLENVLVDAHGHVALTDFGLSKEFVSVAQSSQLSLGGLKTICGTPEYLAPEVLTATRKHTYDSKADWWSFGVLIYEMLHSVTPFYRPNTRALYRSIVRDSPRFPVEIFSKAASVLLKALLSKDPQRRPDFEEIKSYEFFSHLNFDQLLLKRINPPFIPNIQHDADLSFVPTKLILNRDDHVASNPSIETIEEHRSGIRKRRRRTRQKNTHCTTLLYGPPSSQYTNDYCSCLYTSENNKSPRQQRRHRSNPPVHWKGFEYYSAANHASPSSPHSPYTPASTTPNKSKRKKKKQHPHSPPLLALEEEQEEEKHNRLLPVSPSTDENNFL